MSEHHHIEWQSMNVMMNFKMSAHAKAETAVATVIGVVGGVLFKRRKSAHEQLDKDQKDREIRTMIGSNKNLYSMTLFPHILRYVD